VSIWQYGNIPYLLNFQAKKGRPAEIGVQKSSFQIIIFSDGTSTTKKDPLWWRPINGTHHPEGSL
jgi:hypothetical protein